LNGRRIAVVIAVLAFVAALIGPVRVTRVFEANTGHGPGLLGLWMIEPILFGAIAIAAVMADAPAVTWTMTGAVWGFVILGAWSLGSFFAWEGLLLLAGATVHAYASRMRWRALAIPIWLVLGAAIPLVSVLLPRIASRSL
jgi:hypothetical protein